MIRVAGLGLLVALGLTGWVWAEVQGACCRPQATPAGTPSVFGSFDIAGAVPISLAIQNAGDEDRLLSGATPIASHVTLHQTRLVDGRREMAPVLDGIGIPAGETLYLEPAASHLMLIGLCADLVQGQTFPLTLRFERAGEVEVTVRVRRKVDAAGVAPIPPVVAGELHISLASAPPAPASTPHPNPSPRARGEGLVVGGPAAGVRSLLPAHEEKSRG